MPTMARQITMVTRLTSKRIDVSDPRTIDADITLTASDIAARSYFLIDNSANTVTITLPAASEVIGRGMVFKSLSDPAVFAVDLASADNIDGAATFNFTNALESAELVSDGTTFNIIY